MMLKQYIRHRRNGNPIGVLVSTIFEDTSEINYGFSLCSKHDNYDKALGMRIAINRLERDHDLNVPHSIQDMFDEFVVRSENYFYKNAAKTE